MKPYRIYMIDILLMLLLQKKKKVHFYNHASITIQVDGYLLEAPRTHYAVFVEFND